MKKTLFTSAASLLAMVLTLSAHAQQNEVIFKGTTDKQFDGETVSLYNNTTGDKGKVTVENGRFEIRVPFSVATRYMFSSALESKLNGGYVPFGILVEGPGVVNIKADMKAFHKSGVSNAPANEPIVFFNKRSEQLDEVVEKQLAKKHGVKDLRVEANIQQPWFKSAMEFYDSASTSHNNKAMEEMTKKYPDALGSAYVLSLYSNTLPAEKQEQLFGMLSNRVKASSYGGKTAELIEAGRYSAIGKTIKDFSMVNEKGETVDIQSFRGKYVLIDFWASWCVPCLASFPGLQEVYSKYQDKGFEIVGISTDKSETAWLSSVKNNKNPWSQLHDTKGISSKYFAVLALPTTFLVDPTGKIIAKNLHAEELAAELDKLLSAK